MVPGYYWLPFLIYITMKTIKILFAVIAITLTGLLQAQVSVNVNIGTPPPWGPAGYSQVNYYYLPDVEAYYDVRSSMFIYYGGGVWLHRAYLPTRYRHYDLYSGYKVVMTDYHGNTPYTHFKEHKVKYAKGYHGPAQKNNGQKPGKGNSGSQKHDNGNSEKQKGHGGNDSKGHSGNGHKK